jgi:hypothetical protein
MGLTLAATLGVYGQEGQERKTRQAYGPEKKPAPKQMTQEQMYELSKKASVKLPSGPRFYVAPIEGMNAFSMLLTDGSGNNVTGSFSAEQVSIFESVLRAARDFALSDEKVGQGTPVITRFMDQHEWSMFVDVGKLGTKSRFYVSLETINGKVTADAGEITRGSKKEQKALFLTILNELEQAKTGTLPAR